MHQEQGCKLVELLAVQINAVLINFGGNALRVQQFGCEMSIQEVQ